MEASHEILISRKKYDEMTQKGELTEQIEATKRIVIHQRTQSAYTKEEVPKGILLRFIGMT